MTHSPLLAVFTAFDLVVIWLISQDIFLHAPAPQGPPRAKGAIKSRACLVQSAVLIFGSLEVPFHFDFIVEHGFKRFDHGIDQPLFVAGSCHHDAESVGPDECRHVSVDPGFVRPDGFSIVVARPGDEERLIDAVVETLETVFNDEVEVKRHL